MGKDYCAIKGCHNTPGIRGRFGKEVKLHHLPKNKTLKSAWIRAISRKNFRASKYTQVCSDHFPNGDGRTWQYNVPTIYLPQKKTKKVFQSRRTKNSQTPKTAAVSDHSESNSQADDHVDWASYQHFHPYCKATSTISEMENQSGKLQDSDDTKSKCTQSSDITDSTTTGIQTVRPEITIEDIKDSDEKMLFYTGLPNFMIFKALFESLIAYGADRLNADEECVTNMKSNRKLRLVDEFLMVLMRLRLGLLLIDLEYRFKISASRVSRIFTIWIKFMHKCMEEIVFLPTLDILQNKVPSCFKKFKDTRIILDCTEIFIQTPSTLENQLVTYSSYKSHNTCKALVGVSMTGAVVYISKLWGGSASDVHIVRQSGLLNILQAGDAVMVDKGFVNLKSDFEDKGIKFYCPPLLSSSSQFSKSDVEFTRRVASARIHVERKMEQIKNFRILQGVLPISLSKVADSIFFVCSALTNLLPALVK